MAFVLVNNLTPTKQQQKFHNKKSLFVFICQIIAIQQLLFSEVLSYWKIKKQTLILTGKTFEKNGQQTLNQLKTLPIFCEEKVYIIELYKM